MDHDRYVSEIKRIQEQLRKAVGEIDSLELTPEEQGAVDNLPDERRQVYEEILSKYAPASDVDIRRQIVWKGLGILLTRAEPFIREAYELGRKTGEETLG